MIHEVDRSASEWVETNFEDAPAAVMVSIAVAMLVTVAAVTWGKETAEQQTEEDLKIIEEEKTMDDDMLELIKSKLILTKQLDDIAVIQDEARKEIIKDALALAILNDRLNVINDIKKDVSSPQNNSEVPTEGENLQNAEGEGKDDVVSN